MSILQNKYFKFGLATAVYILFVIWVQNFWLLFGIPVIYDIYVSKKVNWTFWKKREGKNSTFIEWLDALIFAVIAVTLINNFIFQNYKIPTGSMENSLLIGDRLFVSKYDYGPRIPFTPLSVPFFQNTLPIVKSKSYLEWIQRPYKRLAGLTDIKREDVVVFNCPALDSVSSDNPTFSYNSDLWRLAEQFRMMDNTEHEKGRKHYLQQAQAYMNSKTDLITRPIDKRDPYIKRCVGVPGDTLQMINGQLFVNHQPEKEKDTYLHRHRVVTNSSRINKRLLEKIGIANHLIDGYQNGMYTMHITEKQKEELKKIPVVDTIFPLIDRVYGYFNQTFPNHPNYKWTVDNFGPLYVPAKNQTIALNTDNLPLYERIINVYEDNTLEVKDSNIFINGERTDSYTFQMDYYFMMGDNRHSSWDSRSWGCVPENHVVGKPKFVWLSTNNEKRFLAKIRWNRFFKGIK